MTNAQAPYKLIASVLFLSLLATGVVFAQEEDVEPEDEVAVEETAEDTSAAGDRS